ncbi:GDP-mannose 4,6-dehydratase [Candidatus Woesearchaeota archaeon]|nr:GDP-mannose 4,6-dehydratase [Candidatus Woesearchaeota archaeon]
MSWTGKKVFITGADGFLGSWLTKRLVREKADVTVLLRDRENDSKLRDLGILEKVNAVYGSVEDLELIKRALNEYSTEVIFHLAAQTLVGIANRSPLSTFESNIKGTWCLLEAARELKVPRIVVASSDKAYGDQEKLPYTEDFCLQGMHPYDVSKSCADMIARTYAKTYGMNIAVTRCGNIYGGGDVNWSRIFPGTIRSLIKGEDPVIRSDGTLVRDYLYVEDAVDAYMMLAEAMESGKLAGQAFNFGTNRPISVLDLVKLIMKVLGKKGKIIVQGNAPNEIREQYLDSTKANRVLGWKPKHTLEQGTEKTYAWYESYLREE